jgi:hypothetical protein
VLLTTNLSGSTLNLRPDRVLHVIRICGVHYVLVTLLWAVTWPIYALGWLGFCLALLRSFLGSASTASGFYVEWMIVLPALVAGIYLMHYFCWYLGLLYKAHHAEFPGCSSGTCATPTACAPRARTPTSSAGAARSAATSSCPPQLPPARAPAAARTDRASAPRSTPAMVAAAPAGLSVSPRVRSRPRGAPCVESATPCASHSPRSTHRRRHRRQRRKTSSSSPRAEAQGAKARRVPELSVTGYPPKDLLLKRAFVATTSARRAIAQRWAGGST